MRFHCPGCREPHPYEKAFEHAGTCSQVREDSKYSAKELGGSNAIERTSIGNEVFVLDNDSFHVFVFNMLTRSAQKVQLNYTATDGQYSKYKQSNSNVLPHNF